MWENRIGPVLLSIRDHTTAFPREARGKLGQFFGVPGMRGCPWGTCDGTILELRPTFPVWRDILIPVQGVIAWRSTWILRYFLTFAWTFYFFWGQTVWRDIRLGSEGFFVRLLSALCTAEYA